LYLQPTVLRVDGKTVTPVGEVEVGGSLGISKQ